MSNILTSEVICITCNQPFQKPNKEINRTIRNNGVHCCCKKCSNKYLSAKNVKPMSYNLRNAKRLAKQKNLECNLTIEYLQQLFDKQNGLCALSGIHMERVWKNNKKKLDQVSIDRLDNSKGYTMDNIQLVTLGMNYLRNTFDIEDTKEFINLLKK